MITPLDHIVFILWILSCIVFYMYEKKLKKRLKKKYKKKVAKKVAKVKKWKKTLAIDGE